MDGFHKAIKRGMRPYGSTNGTIAGLSVSRAGHCRSWKADIRSGREEIQHPLSPRIDTGRPPLRMIRGLGISNR